MLHSNYVKNLFVLKSSLKTGLKHIVLKRKEKGAMLFDFARSGTVVT